MKVVRTETSTVCEYYFDDDVEDGEATRRVLQNEVAPSDEWEDFSVDVYDDPE